MTLASGTRLGAYEILGPLGAGGMGEVYRARDSRLAREVALKVLPEEFLEGEEKKTRFEREAKLLAALNHPNIAAVFSFEEIPGSSSSSSSSSSRHILVMELIEGETLRKAFPPEPLAAKKILDVAVQIAEGLAKAHASGFVHRDLKPENVMVSREGWVKILDFGLAKLTESRSQSCPPPRRHPGPCRGWSWEPWATCPPSRPSAAPSIFVPTSSPSGRCSTSLRRAAAPSSGRQAPRRSWP
jgi:serine/threonine protein kinase